MAPFDHSTQQRSSADIDVGAHFAKRINVARIYMAVLLLLAAAIVWSGIKTAQGVQQYHIDYKTLQDMKKQERKLQIEHQRLLIEQQTFSATPQIASRAVAELSMYSPTLKDKLIIQPGVPVAETALQETAPQASVSEERAQQDTPTQETPVDRDEQAPSPASAADTVEAAP